MRRWMVASLAITVAVGLTTSDNSRAYGQPKDGPVAEKFKTADGVELHSLFHPADPMVAKNANQTPVVVFLYPPGPDRDMTKGDWAGLAKDLTKAGYHVFQFDWRGHGKSTTITNPKTFWGNPYLNGNGAKYNAYIKTGPKGNMKADLNVKADLGLNANRYLPAYMNDLAAVRYHLDTKNDNNELNTSSIYVIGSGDAAVLGMAWIATEWHRQRTYPNVLQLGVPRYEFVPQILNGGLVAGSEAGNDFGGAVWLTPTKPQFYFTDIVLKGWISNANRSPSMRENNPMLFLYGDKDDIGKRATNFFYNEMFVAEPKKGSTLAKLKQTFATPVANAGNLQGVKLLGDNAKLGTEKTILEYLAARQKEREKIAPKERKYNDPYYIDVRWLDIRTP
ncbi:MAG: alpha/beta hydrolase [Planctomycetes bacterium]|nr:alpha/beta hydrolase [Planctomycetota bacterium]